MSNPITARERYRTLALTGLCVTCGKNEIAFGHSRIRCLPCLEANRKRPLISGYINGALKARDQRRRLKLEVFNAYGGPICHCCGETEFMFLELDHRYNDGATHRIKIHGSDVYKWAKANEYPPVFRVLCSNCNKGKHKAGGVCPHVLAKFDWLKPQEAVRGPSIGTASLCFRDDITATYAVTFGKVQEDRIPGRGGPVTKFVKTLCPHKSRKNVEDFVCDTPRIDFNGHELIG